MSRTVTILAVGGKHDPDLAPSITRYETRLKGSFDLKWQLLAYSQLADDDARREESTRLLEKISDKDFVVLLDERGAQTTSEGLAAKIEAVPSSKQLIYVIGGAYGVDDRLRKRADQAWALSQLVFPHQLVRLILIEQLYRAEMIRQHHPYHHQ